MKRPAEVYEKSSRKYEEVDIEYPYGIEPRKVRMNGSIKIKSKALFITTAFVGLYVGIEQIDEENYLLWFDNLRLAEINLKLETVIWTKSLNKV